MSKKIGKVVPDLEVGNLEDYYTDDLKVKYINPNPWTIQHSTSVIFYDKTRSGKTNLMSMLLLNPKIMMAYNRVYVICKDPTENKYKFLIKQFADIDERMAKNGTPTNTFTIVSGIDTMPDLDTEIDPTKQNIIIFDDLCLEKNQDKIEAYYIRALKRNCSCFYLTQSYYRVSKEIRNNTYYFGIWELPSRREQSLLRLDVTNNDDLSQKQFNKMIRGVTDSRKDNKNTDGC